MEACSVGNQPATTAAAGTPGGGGATSGNSTPGGGELPTLTVNGDDRAANSTSEGISGLRATMVDTPERLSLLCCVPTRGLHLRQQRSKVDGGE